MLKVIAFENFVHFEEKQVINLETEKRKKKTARGISADTEEAAKGISDDKKDTARGISDETDRTAEDDAETKNKLNFFVGANFCGKSTVLELIRRCMTKEINVSVTRSFNENKVAYVLCKFDLNSQEVISGVITKGSKCVPFTFCKILIYTDGRGKILRCNTFKSSDSKPKESFHAFAEPGGEGVEDVLKHIFDKQNKESTCIELILDKIQSKKNIIKKGEREVDWKDLEKTYVATMPLRGIGTVQWTKSKKIKDKKKNYKMACKRAEIISKLLSSESIVTAEEKKLFGYLTYPQKFEFKKKGKKEIRVQHVPSDPFQLLKTSEGILEAKQVSLLLAHKDIKTLCLEEPDRGMHAQMIERLRAILYQEGWKKTIIVSTHSRYFIDSSTINNTHVFFRTESNDPDYSCNVTNVGLQNELSKVSDVETLRNLLFATKVLLVEGPTDRDVVQALFTHLRESRQREIDNEEKSDITTYQIIPIGGCKNAKNVLKFCEYINLPSLCLLDRDKFVSIKKLRCIRDELSPFEISFQWVVKRFLEMEKDMINWFNNEYVDTTESFFLDNGFEELSDYLRTEKIFIWKYGALEDAILSSENMNEDIAKSLNIKFTDITPRSNTLKSKLKQRLDEEERRLFSEHLYEVDEIKRFLDFMMDEEDKRIQRFVE